MRPSHGVHATERRIPHRDVLRCGIFDRPMSARGQKQRPSQPRHVSFRRLRTLVREHPLVKPCRHPARRLLTLLRLATASWAELAQSSRTVRDPGTPQETIATTRRDASGQGAPEGSCQDSDTPADGQTGGRNEASFCEVGVGPNFGRSAREEEPIFAHRNDDGARDHHDCERLLLL
jgi:hypothetical protein